MLQALTKPLTLEEFLKLPETKPASEYIDNQIIQKPMPQGEHSTVQGELIITVNAVVKPQKIARAYPELRCTFGGRSIVPDVSVFVWDRIPRKEKGGVANAFNLAPDWTIEILSPDQSQTRSWNLSIHNCVKQIQRTNSREKAKGTYVSAEELAVTLEDAYDLALEKAAIEAFEGKYEAEELSQLVQREEIIKKAINLIWKREIDTENR